MDKDSDADKNQKSAYVFKLNKNFRFQGKTVESYEIKFDDQVRAY